MKKSEFEKIQKRYGIMDFEVENICDFVSEMLHMKAREIEENEPYATRTINKLDDAAYEAYNLIEYIADIEEE